MALSLIKKYEIKNNIISFYHPLGPLENKKSKCNYWFSITQLHRNFASIFSKPIYYFVLCFLIMVAMW
jgi:hypothetical protein